MSLNLGLPQNGSHFAATSFCRLDAATKIAPEPQNFYGNFWNIPL
jgi:hypothetical protein